MTDIFRIIDPIEVTDTGSFTRASIKTYWDKDGVLQTAAVDEPCWNYDPADLTAPPQLLIEEADTNTIDYSEDFDNASWTKSSGVTVTPNLAIAPNGTMTMDMVVSPTAGADTRIFNGGAVANDALDHRARMFVTIGNAQYVRMDLRYSGGAPLTYAYAFDLVNLSFVQTSGGSVASAVGIIRLPSGQCMLTIDAPNNASGNTTMSISLYPASNSNGINILAGYSYAWGAHDNFGSYIKTPSGAAVTRAADVWTGMMLSSLPEADYAEYNPLTGYLLEDRCMVTSAAYHNIYQSKLADVNLGNDPTLEIDPVEAPENWQLVSKTNRWKPFDQYVSSQAAAADRLYYSLQVPAGKMFDSISLRNLDAYEVRIAVVHPTEGVVYSDVINLISDSGIIDYWEYFFSPIERALSVTLTGLPAYDDVRVDVTVIYDTGTALLGSLVVGLSYDIGNTQLGLGLGGTDYSVKKITEFGNIYLKPRPYSDEMRLLATVQKTSLAYVKNLLNRLRGKPNVYIAGDSMDSDAGTVHGWHDTYDIVVEYQLEAVISTNIKGLT